MKRLKYEKKWLTLGYRKIFVVSNVQKRDIMENFNISEDKISVIYPGVDIPEEHPNCDCHCEPASQTWQPKNSDVIFGLSAPGFQRKGGYVLLKAISILKNKNSNFKAKIIYPGYSKNLYIKMLLKLYGIEKYVDFIDFQKDMNDFYSSINCLVAPSLEDTFNLTVLEAMARKKVCIVSSSAGASEIIQDGKNGFVFAMDKNGAKNLAKKMALVISNPDNIVNNCIINGYNTAKIYSWDRMFNDFVSKL